MEKNSPFNKRIPLKKEQKKIMLFINIFKYRILSFGVPSPSNCILLKKNFWISKKSSNYPLPQKKFFGFEKIF